MSQPLRLIAPAKVNLCLHITGKREDGFHLLESLAAFTAFGDVLEISPARHISLRITGQFAAPLLSEPPESNLIIKAAHALAAATGSGQGAAITLEKRVPIGAGLGGGSSDAATALRGLQKLWRTNLPDSAISALALKLGSDIPACLQAQPLWMSGIGEHTRPAALPKAFLLLVNPRLPLPTPQVYRAFRPPFSPLPPAMPHLPDATALGIYLAATHNALQPPAISELPVIRHLLSIIGRQPGCLLSRMSGSGATCFGLFAHEAEAAAAHAAILATYPHWWAVPTPLRS